MFSQFNFKLSGVLNHQSEPQRQSSCLHVGKLIIKIGLLVWGGGRRGEGRSLIVDLSQAKGLGPAFYNFKGVYWWVSIIIFQQKITITTPPNFMNPYNSLPYVYANGYVNLMPTGLPYQSPALQNMMLPNQLYSVYYPGPARFLSSLQQPYNISTMSPAPPGIPVLPQQPSSTQTHRLLARKIQKKEKQSQMQIVNLVSDDEEPVQPEKPCQDRNTTSNSKPHEYNGLPASPLIPHTKPKDRSHKKPAKTVPEPEEAKAHIKNEKPKEIVKHKQISKKQKSVKQVTSCSSKRSNIYSKRIIEKEDSKKPPFRISKRERELLEIGYLRELKTVILTGPQFQVKLPSFQSQSPNLLSWLAKKREDLLARQYEEDSDEE